MKRGICLMLLFCVLLCGCSIAGERIKEPVTFYYVTKDYQENMDPVIGSEIREASGHRYDLSYLLALYSMGPSEENLKSPLPRNTRIELHSHTSEALELHLSDSVLTISDADFTLASACIALTCMELSSAEKVTVVCGEKSISIVKDQLLFTGSLSTLQEEGT